MRWTDEWRHNSKDWIVLGTSPSAKDWYPKLKAAASIPTIITCNDGIDLEPWPHYLCTFDPAKHRKNRKRFLLAKAKGSVVVGIEKMAKKSCGSQPGDIDIVIETDGETAPTRDSIRSLVSGVVMLQIACRGLTVLGGGVVRCVGMEGYRKFGRRATNGGDYFHGKGNGWGLKHREVMKKMPGLLQQVVDLHPEIEFIWYGDLAYDIEGDNVRRVE